MLNTEHPNKAFNFSPAVAGLGLSLLRSASPLTRRYVLKETISTYQQWMNDGFTYH
ncbi:MAG: hypothetical protein ABW170_17525 [Candidatus Thiodiazotropha sp. L084R]